MPDYSTPFAKDAIKRTATADEKLNGFPCGAANQALFNGLVNQLQADLYAIHVAGGVAGSDEDTNTTLLNIQALINAATGGGDDSDYVLLSQARTRLPIFPEFLTADGKINVSSPATGTIRIPSGIDFLHRGIKIETTVETDFTTDVSKTYHVRWNPTDGYQMLDLESGTYNAGSLDETDAVFDSTYDDMLICRVITNSSNVATITNLVNKNRLIDAVKTRDSISHAITPTVLVGTSFDFEWSRTPLEPIINIRMIGAHSFGASNNIGHDLRMFGFEDPVFSRYGINDLEYVYQDDDGSAGRILYSTHVEAR